MTREAATRLPPNPSKVPPDQPRVPAAPRLRPMHWKSPRSPSKSDREPLEGGAEARSAGALISRPEGAEEDFPGSRKKRKRVGQLMAPALLSEPDTLSETAQKVSGLNLPLKGIRFSWVLFSVSRCYYLTSLVERKGFEPSTPSLQS